MKATVKCSNCGAEITNLNFSWGKKEWIWLLPIIPIIIIGFLPLWNLTKPKADFREDLKITILEKRQAQNYEILGFIENTGKTKWENINIDCDFFDSKGVFIDKASDHVRAVVMPGGKEFFKITVINPSSRLTSPGVDLKVKIADANTSPF